jgi:hypothetical protein
VRLIQEEFREANKKRKDAEIEEKIDTMMETQIRL